MNYKQAEQLLDGRVSRKIGNNTYIKDRGGYIAIQLHDTDVVEFHPTFCILNSGGWKTNTTKDRINEYAPIAILQHDYTWYLEKAPYTWKYKTLPVFEDRMCIDYEGKIL